MRLDVWYTWVAQVADTEGTAISAAECSRVLACARQVSRRLPWWRRFFLAWQFFFD